jgi:hypothetical protein
MMANVVSMIETAVPVRFPDLRIGIMESGITWIPFITNRLDKEYLERRRRTATAARSPQQLHSPVVFRDAPSRGDLPP